MRPSFFHHLHPPTIPAAQSRLRYTLGAGGLSVFFSLVLIVSGVLLMYYYTPTPQEAPLSIQTLTFLVPFGWLVRNLHYWAAQLLVLVVVIHLLRVIFTGAYAPPRRFNYLLGLILLVICVLLDFTGYVLRWDTGIQWALVVGTNLVKSIPVVGGGLYAFLIGGSQPGAATLVRFYTWHIFGLTIILLIISGWHLFRVRRDGGIAVPPPELRPDNNRITRFELVRREVLAMLWASVGLVLLSIILPAPIAQPIQEGSALAADARAPWFFLWVQELLKLGDPFLWGVLIPLVVTMLFILMPYLLPNARPSELGRWFPPGNCLAQAVSAMIVIFILLVTTLALL